MSITRSYNKHTGIYYAYDTTYVWDESKQKKVQKKVCIGQFDPETDQVIPNAKRGRPRKKDIIDSKTQNLPATESKTPRLSTDAISFIEQKIDQIENSVAALTNQLQDLRGELNKLIG